MSAINDLISQIEDKELRERIEQELDKFSKQKKFGLVFEEHFPECVPLYDVPVKKGCKVALKAGKVNEYYTVMQVEGDNVYCTDKKESKLINFLKQDLVCIAEFGEPIYPYLKKIDEIYRGDEPPKQASPTHALIQADNYHALQLLQYLYAGKVDCIYIDPPYNTGARDWKYNNDYVDSSDTYRHSKWLSMMKKRLLLAKKLLNPEDSVMIVTIDEKEYLHLGCLLEDLFPEARIQMIASQITPQGNPRVNQFYRTDEYVFFVGFGEAHPESLPLDSSWRTGLGESPTKNINWVSLLRTGSGRRREDRPNMFYPFFIRNTENGPIIDSIGDTYLDEDLNNINAPDGTVAVWPKGSDDELRRWQVSAETARDLLASGFLRLGKWNGEDTAIQYLAETNRLNILNGNIPIIGKRYDGSVIVDEDYIPTFIPGSLWRIPSHDATRNGSQLLKSIIGNRFSFPKSLYAVHDAIRFFVANKPNALIVDFFAGSGTTLHAVNLLNAEDGGKRQCIMVTNNEVSDDEAKTLTAKGFAPGDAEWEKLGIANYVTWPRTICSINGKDIKGEPLKGNYIGSELPMADGFKANAVFFKLGFLDKTSVQLGRQFKELLPLLWLKAGGWGKCPDLNCCTEGVLGGLPPRREGSVRPQSGLERGGDFPLPPYIIFPENHFAVLIDEKFFSEFEPKVNAGKEIWTAFIVTDFEKGFMSMTKNLNVKKSYQLYRDYLGNFRINTERN